MASGQSSDQSAVVWEWKDDYCWMAYESPVSNFIEQLHQTHSSANGAAAAVWVNLDKADTKMGDYEVDISSMNQKRLLTGRLRPIRRTIRKLDPSITHQWEWNSYADVFIPYQEDESKALEFAYIAQAPTCKPSPLYEVNIKDMKQRNINTGFIRKVRRVPVNQSYIIVDSKTLDDASGSSSGVSSGSSSGSSSSKSGSSSSKPPYNAAPYNVPRKKNPGESSKSGSSSQNGSHAGSKSGAVPKKAKPAPPPVASSSSSSFSNSGLPGYPYSSLGNSVPTPAWSTTPPFNTAAVSVGSTPGRLTAIPKLNKFLEKTDLKKLKESNQPECPICLNSFDEVGSEEEPDADVDPDDLVWLNKCHHAFHVDCITQSFQITNANNNDGCLVCPMCKAVYGELRGTQPRNGRMVVYKCQESCAGHDGCGSIVLEYHFQPGVQGAEHPNPGQPFRVVGFPRVAYLPDNEEGNRAARLLKKAFDRRLVFSVGRSVTTGADNCVIWNIHHKTSRASPDWGFPDPNYFPNLFEELKANNVTESDL